MTAGFGVALDAGGEQALNNKIKGTNNKELSHSNFLNSRIVESAFLFISTSESFR